MGATIEGIQVAFGVTGLDTIGAGVATTDSTLAGLGATADVVGASLASMADRALASGASMDSLAASVSTDGEAFMSLTDVMAQLNSIASDQTLAITSDGEAMATLGSVMADLDAFAAQTAASMQAEGDAAAYLAMMGDAAAPALAKTAEASAATSAALDTTAASAEGAALGMDTLKNAATGIGIAALAAGALGVASVKMAGDFDSGMLTIKTGAGGLHENLAQLSSQVLGLSTATGTGTKGLIDGLFQIESSGQRSAQAIDTLRISAEAAKVGNADLGTVANGVTTIMTDFASANVTAAQAANSLVAAVGDGKTNMQALSSSLSSILPVASSVKVGLNDVMGAMATMTGEGVPAADAATYLRQMLMTLASPAKAGAAALKEIGLSAQQVSDDMKKSLPDTLAMIEDHLKKKFPEGSIAYQDALKAIAGGSKQMQGMLDLTGSHLATFGSNVTDIAGKVKAGGSAVVGWSDVQKDFNFAVDQAKSSLEVLGITIGSKLLPYVAPLISNAANGISAFSAWANSGHAMADAFSLTGKYSQIVLPVLATLAALVGGILVPVFWSWASATIAATWPVLAVAAAIGVAVAALIWLNNTFPPVHAALVSIGVAFQQFGNTVSGIFDAFQRKAAESTLQAKLSSINNTIAQKQAMIQHYEEQKQRIIQLMGETTSTVEKKALEAKLASIQAAEQQANGVIAAAQKQKQGVESQLSQIDPVVALHALKQKDVSVSQSLVQAEQTVSNLTRQRQGIEQELKGCTDATQRASLEMQLKATDAALKQKENVVKALEQQKAGVQKAMSDQQQIIQKDSGGNALISIWKNVASWMATAFSSVKNALAPLSPVFAAVWQSLQDIWKLVQSQFGPIMQQLSDTFKNSLIPAWQSLQSSMQSLAPVGEFLLNVLKGVGIVIGGALLLAVGLLMGTLTGLANFFGNFIAGIIKWVGGFVLFFSGMVQVVTGFWTGLWNVISDIFHGQWGKIGSDVQKAFGQMGAGLHNMVAGIWQMIQGAFQAGIGAVLGFLQGFVSGVYNFFKDLYERIVGHSIVPDMINGVVGWFLQLPGRAGSAIANMVSSVTGKLGSLLTSGLAWAGNFVTGLFNSLGKLAGQAGSAIQTAVNKIMSVLAGALGAAASAGANIVKAIADGILNNISSFIGNAMNAVGNFIQSHLPHSPAKMGPLVTLAQSGANIPAQIAAGMLSNKSVLQTGMTALLSPIVGNSSSALLGTPSIGASSNQPIVLHTHNHIYIDGRAISDASMQHVLSDIRSSGHPLQEVA